MLQRESEEARRAREKIFRQEKEEKEKGKLSQKLAGSAGLHDGSSSNDWTGVGFTVRISAFSHQGDSYFSHNLKHGFKYITLPEMESLSQMIDKSSWINCFVKCNESIILPSPLPHFLPVLTCLNLHSPSNPWLLF